MSGDKKTDLVQAAMGFQHGGALLRRDVLKVAVALSLTSILAPSALAQDVAVDPPEANLKPAGSAGASPIVSAPAETGVSRVSITTEAGRQVSGALALPKDLKPGDKVPSILVLHEWWGLNDQMKAFARALADEGYLVLVADLNDGLVTTTAATALFQSRNVTEAASVDIMTSWGTWLRAHEASTDKLGTCGLGSGGGWSLRASMSMTVDATVIYYGDVARSAEELRGLKGPVLGHFASRDMFISTEMVAEFQGEMTKAGRIATVNWYDADHAFANPVSARYDEEDAKLAWGRTLAFFKSYLNETPTTIKNNEPQ